MANIIKMPRLSDTMTEGVVAHWFKKVGDTVKEGDILAEIETDKATMEFESFYNGTLLHIGVPEGQGASVDSLLAIIGKEGEDISSLLQDKIKLKQDDKTESEKNNYSGKSDFIIPDGIDVVKMPRLSDTMTEGVVAHWFKKVGDTVKEGDILAEIETDKATMEFESFYSGTLLHIGLNEGESAPVDSILAIIGKEGVDISNVLNNSKSMDGNIEKQAELSKKEITKPNTNEIINTKRIIASPIAKKIAKDKGIDLSNVKGSGTNGRIIRVDMENFITLEKSIKTPYEKEIPFISDKKAINYSNKEHPEEVKNSQIRKAIASRVTKSFISSPSYYLTIDVDMDQTIESRKTINKLSDAKISYNDMVIKASAMALRKHPKINSQWTDNYTIVNYHINIAVAVSIEDGLVLPVIQFADQLNLTQISTLVKDKVERANSKKLSEKEMEGSTFTISNLGMLGISEFSSILNKPNVAILSVGSIIEKPVVKNGEIVIGNKMKLTLTCDHRLIDGATGANFLKTLKEHLENPVTMLA